MSARDAFRRKGGIDAGDRIELEGESFAALVYEGYAEIAKNEPNRIARIDASGTKDETRKKIEAVLEKVCAKQ